ncbi:MULTISPECIES: D-Ala-D-Ala carboxypeptidase family metallohydrolase [Moraxella]|uniref:Peptidase M15A C-terminal domain-containing protein n=1 Tax=Moraxella catarrhalis TaxID=480 RepID=A0A7Z0UY77_MORCA|nr:D-Ala-D-Ala carboxypeptidase family metallohydrolase [Moraxella catarrhalis]OAV00219.1 hypothetical protein AO382_1369 [Moraxella catarrhalis]STY82487.1 Peptidase M15 [Moraxella catarrhalis]
MQISKNFHLLELIHSDTAIERGIKNTPSTQHKANLVEATHRLWQPVRDLLGVAMRVNSGYRSHALNRAVNGSQTSAHSHGLAIDFVAPKFGNTRQIAKFLASELPRRGIRFDQLILEHPDALRSWIHLGYKHPDGRQRGQLLTAVKKGGKTVYLKGLH